MAEWFYIVDQRQLGPLTDEQMRGMLTGGRVPWSSLVWREGMAQWTEAQTLPELRATAPVAAMPVAAMPVATAPVLQYQAQTDVAWSQGVPEDPGPFSFVGKQMTVASQRWVGVGYATPRAFYLVLNRRMASQTGFAVGGLAGALIAAAAQSDDNARTCFVSELPPGIQANIDPKHKFATKDVVVLPRESISLVKLSFWGGGLTIRVGAETFKLVPGMFSFGRIRRDLTGMTWPLGVEMTPTINAPYAKGLRPGAKRTSPWLKALYVIIGIIIFIAVIVLRVIGGH